CLLPFSVRSRSPSEVLARALARPRVGPGALPVHGQALPVTQAAIAAEIHEPLDVRLNLAARVALHLHVRFDRVANGLHLGLGELLDALVLRHVREGTEAPRGSEADPVDVREGVEDVLATGKVDSSNACHRFPLTLSPGAACGAGCCRSRAGRPCGALPCTFRKSS